MLGRFVKDKIYEETSKEYTTILSMLVKDKADKACLQTRNVSRITYHVSDEKQSLFSVCVLYPVCSLHFVLTM